MEWHLRIVPVFSPTVHKKSEKFLVHRDIKVVGLSLIPYDTLDRELLHSSDSCFVKAGRGKRMVGYTSLRISKIYLSHLDAPLIESAVCEPILKNLRALGCEGFPCDPSLCRRTSYCIADETDRHVEALTEHSSEMISYGTESPHIFLVAGLPFSRAVEIHILGLLHMLIRPLDHTQMERHLHIEETQILISEDFAIVNALPYPEIHIGLSRAYPDVTCRHIVIYKSCAFSLYRKSEACSSLQRSELDIPLAICRGFCLSGLCTERSVKNDLHSLTWISISLDHKRYLPLKDHTVRIHT